MALMIDSGVMPLWRALTQMSMSACEAVLVLVHRIADNVGNVRTDGEGVLAVRLLRQEVDAEDGVVAAGHDGDAERCDRAVRTHQLAHLADGKRARIDGLAESQLDR